MLLRSLHTLCALTIVIEVNAAPVLAEDPLPAGTERMLFPAAKHEFQLQLPVWADYNGSWSFEFGTKGMRPTDVEIEWFDFKPNTKDLADDPVWQVVSVVEMPNEGPFECEGWWINVATTEDGITMGQQDQSIRPIDVDLYYRQDPFLGTVEPTYASIWVSNTGLQYSDWNWIPAMPYHPFMNLLEEVCGGGNWRPYDIDFAVDQSGQVMGTALLAPMETFSESGDSLAVPTIWEWFDPSQIVLQLYEEEGWQLLDVEVPPDGLAGGPFGNEIAKYHDLGYRFGIFVNTMFVEYEDTSVGVLAENSGFPDQWGGTLEFEIDNALLIDLERDGTDPGDKSWDGGIFEIDFPLYTSAWLLGE